jgi:hypothetical protein
MEQIITVTVLPLENALAEIGESSYIPANLHGWRVSKQVTRTIYTVVVPQTHIRAYPAAVAGRASDMPAFWPVEKRVRFRIGASEADAQYIAPVVSDRIEGGVEYTATCPIPLNEGKGTVWSEVVEFTSPPEREPFLINTMSVATNRLRVDFSVEGMRNPAIDASVIAFGRPSSDPIEVVAKNRIIMRWSNLRDPAEPSWLLPGHGYLIWWWEREPKIETWTPGESEERPAAAPPASR